MNFPFKKGVRSIGLTDFHWNIIVLFVGMKPIKRRKKRKKISGKQFLIITI